MIATYYHSPEPSAITVMTRSNRTKDPLEAWTAHVQEEGGCVRTSFVPLRRHPLTNQNHVVKTYMSSRRVVRTAQR